MQPSPRYTSTGFPLPNYEARPEPQEITRLRDQATEENPAGCFTLGEALLAFDERTYAAEALDWFALAAHGEHPGGHYRLALHYSGPGNDPRMAAYHLEASAFERYWPAVKLLNAWKVEGKAEFENDDEANRLLEEAVTQGSNPARFQLAQRITKGRGIRKDPQRAAQLYAQAAEGGHPGAMHGIGVCYVQGYGLDRDTATAFQWFNRAAEHDYPDAWYALGLMRHNDPEYRTLAEAAKCFAQAARLDHAQGTFSLALLYEKGEGVPQDSAKATSLLVRAANLGQAQAQFWLGNAYRNGTNGAAQDFERSAQWYERAAAQEHPGAIYHLGLQSLLGHGVGQDVDKGWDLVEKAANLGVVEAMVCLASMIDSGEGRVDDPEESLRWYRKAADLGSADAQLAAGKRLKDVPGEKKKARAYLEKAAGQGSEEARELLKSIPEDAPLPKPPAPPTAAETLAAAIAGDARSQYQAGFAHFMGIGVPKDAALSYFWFSVLSKTMPAQAAQMLQMLGSQVSAETRQKLDRAAAEWQPGSQPPATA